MTSALQQSTIKFSPFEVLFIGDKNNVINSLSRRKRKVPKNNTNLFNLRELFNVDKVKKTKSILKKQLPKTIKTPKVSEVKNMSTPVRKPKKTKHETSKLLKKYQACKKRCPTHLKTSTFFKKWWQQRRKTNTKHHNVYQARVNGKFIKMTKKQRAYLKKMIEIDKVTEKKHLTPAQIQHYDEWSEFFRKMNHSQSDFVHKELTICKFLSKDNTSYTDCIKNEFSMTFVSEFDGEYEDQLMLMFPKLMSQCSLVIPRCDMETTDTKPPVLLFDINERTSDSISSVNIRESRTRQSQSVNWVMGKKVGTLLYRDLNGTEILLGKVVSSILYN